MTLTSADWNQRAPLGHTWVMDRFTELLLEKVREEVEALISEIRIARGSKFDLALTSSSEVEKVTESLNQIAAKAIDRCQFRIEVARAAIQITDKQPVFAEIRREFDRIPQAIAGK